MRHDPGAVRVFAFPGGSARDRAERDERGLRRRWHERGLLRTLTSSGNGLDSNEMQSARSRKDPARGDEDSLAWCNSRVEYSSK